MSTLTELARKHALDSGGDESNSSDEWAGPKPSEINQVNLNDVDAGPLPPAPKKRKSWL